MASLASPRLAQRHVSQHGLAVSPANCAAEFAQHFQCKRQQGSVSSTPCATSAAPWRAGPQGTPDHDWHVDAAFFS
jgi:hypothetical protein